MNSTDRTPPKNFYLDHTSVTYHQDTQQEEEKLGNRGNNEQDYQSPDVLKTVERKNEEKKKMNTQSFLIGEITPLDSEHYENSGIDETKRSSYYSQQRMMMTMSDYRVDLDQSVSSMQITNYDDSEFMINAYKKKKI